MTAHYDIHLRVPVAKLATILEVLNGEGKLLSVTEAEAPKAQPRAVRPAEKGEDFVLRLLRSKPLSTAELSAYFKADGRNANSASPCLSSLLKASKITRKENGKYSIVE